MAAKDLTTAQVNALAGTRDPATGILIPQDYATGWWPWLVQTLMHLAASAAGWFLVVPDDASATTVRVLPGRCISGATAYAYAGGAIDLAAGNNATSYVWLSISGGAATIGHGLSTGGWPGTTHHKLAEVTLSAGVITTILDRRIEKVFTV